jgi:propanol-preferring alcohol dehydrogenase
LEDRTRCTLGPRSSRSAAQARRRSRRRRDQRGTAYDGALRCLRPTGTLSVVGLPTEPLQIPASAVVASELRIAGSAVGTRDDIRAVLDLAARGKIRCRIETRPLSQVNQVLDAMRRSAIEGRMVLDPNL